MMTNTEALAVQTLLEFLLAPGSVPDGKVRLAAETLASRSYRVLRAGLDSTQVAEQWPSEKPGEGAA